MNKKYIVELTADERRELTGMISRGKAPARKLTHARILLKADVGSGRKVWTDEAISAALEVSVPTVERVRQAFVTESLEAALSPRPSKKARPRKIGGRQEAQLITIACSTPPQGQGRWTLQLLADRMVELRIVDSISHETVRQTLKKTNLSLG